MREIKMFLIINSVNWKLLKKFYSQSINFIVQIYENKSLIRREIPRHYFNKQNLIKIFPTFPFHLIAFHNFPQNS